MLRCLNSHNCEYSLKCFLPTLFQGTDTLCWTFVLSYLLPSLILTNSSTQMGLPSCIPWDNDLHRFPTLPSTSGVGPTGSQHCTRRFIPVAPTSGICQKMRMSPTKPGLTLALSLSCHPDSYARPVNNAIYRLSHDPGL